MTFQLNRRQFGTACAATGLASTLPTRFAQAQGTDIKLKYGTAFPADHPGTLRIKEAAEAIRKDTSGKVDLQVYPTSQLGSEPDMISQTRAGAIDFMSTAGTNLQTLVPTAGINGVAFAFKDYAAVWAAMDGELGAHVRSALAKVNLFAFDKCLDNGYRNITTSSKAINTPEDLKGFKIRVPGIPLWISMFKALGASPTAIPFGELYSSLQTKVVDGQENPLALIQSAKLYEVQKFCSLTGHTWDGHFIFGNAKKMQALPKEVQAALVQHLNAAALKQREDIAKLNQDAQAQLSKLGVTFNRPDPGPFRELLKSAGFYTEWKAKYGDEVWSKLEKYAGRLI
ncbi:TRAP transporter substrate-binding protein [Aquabacterium sp.]|uniref:TRAP transporter substrate-binding protein n=1 Tax=Aquabacterium sp. TaxID=1872578 RepID=UPI002BB325C7|nr:TRAP transporter substrate-binding protein [Aquabacterium sp.]HSW06758.1 TRAP transporter substrate-binding protein [Aquabacterium sp.]